jgi:hypothetical protein
LAKIDGNRTPLQESRREKADKSFVARVIRTRSGRIALPIFTTKI